MDTSFSAAVVGGGIIGLSIAWRLAQAGLKVTVLDKGVIGSEASWAAAGMLAPGGEFFDDSELARLAIESRKLFPDFVAELSGQTGLDIDLQQMGALDLAYDDAELAALDQRAKKQATLGIRSKPLTTAQIIAFWPRVRREGLAGGYFYPDDAVVDPRHVVAALARACLQLGVRLLEHTPATQLSSVPAGMEVNGVAYHAAVIAAGAWSGSLPLAGAPPLPLTRAVRGHLVGYRQPEQICNTIIRRGHTYLIQRSSGFLITGASTENVGFNRDLDNAIASQLSADSAFLMPHLGETTPTEIWNGLRPASDSLHLGPWPNANGQTRLYLAYGHLRNGILLAPLSAQRITDAVTANL